MPRLRYSAIVLLHIISSPVGDKIMESYADRFYQDQPISTVYDAEDIGERCSAIQKPENIGKCMDRIAVEDGILGNMAVRYGGEIVWSR